ncbi:hypothetical protein COOONC_03323 [Cooperia oncophora]
MYYGHSVGYVARPLQIRDGKGTVWTFLASRFDDRLRPAMELIADDRSLTPHLKASIRIPFEIKSELDDVLARNKQLLEENKQVKERNSELENEIIPLSIESSLQLNKSRDSSSAVAYDDVERKRSVIVAGIQECVSPLASVRVSYDLACKHQIPFEMKSELDDVLARNKQLLEENKQVKERNSELENEIIPLSIESSLQLNKSRDSSSAVAYDDVERKRSVIVAGIQECVSPIASVRVSYDLACIRRINDFLSIDCQPICVYRMGRYISGKPRLLKVVFPSSFFSSLLLKRAPKLRFFSEQGIFVRRSLSLAERQLE